MLRWQSPGGRRTRRIADLHQNMAEAVPDRGSPDHEHGVADGPAAANDTVRPDLRDLRIAGGKDRGVHVAAQGERNPLLELASGEPMERG